MPVFSVSSAYAIDEFTVDADNSGTFDADELASSPFDWGGLTNGTGAAGEATGATDIQVNATGTLLVTDTDDIGDNNALVDAISFAANSLTLFIDDSLNDDSAESISISGNIGLNAVAEANLIITGEDTDVNPDTLAVDINGDVDLGTGSLTITSDNLNIGNDVSVSISGNLFAASTTLNSAASTTTLIFDGGVAQSINGTINGGAPGEGVLEITGAGTVVSSSGVWGGVSNLDQINIISGATLTTGDAITANTITVGASSTLNTGGLVTGNLNFTGAGGTLALGDNLGIAGAVDNLSGGDGVGIITSASTSGNTSSISGVIGETNSLNEIELLGDGQITFSSAVNAQTIIASAANGTLDFNNDVTGNIELQADAIVDLAAGIVITGGIDNTSGADGSGEVFLETTGDSNNITGTIGSTNSLRLLTLSGAGEATFDSSVNVDDVVFAGDTEVNFFNVTSVNGIDFVNNNGEVSFVDGSTVLSDVFSTGGENGTVIFDGSGTLSGQLGTSAATGIAFVNLNGVNSSVSVSNDSFVGTLQILNGSTLTLDSNLTASTVITNNGIISLDETSVITSAAFDGTGSYYIPISDDGDNILNSADFATFSSSGAIDLSDETVEILFSGTPVTGTATIGSGGAAASAPLAVRDDSFILSADIAANGNDLELTVRTDAANASSTVNGKNVGAIIDNLLGSTNPQISAIIDSVLSVTNTQELDELLDSTTSTVDAGALMASLMIANQMYSLTRLRLANLNTGRSSYMTGISSGSASQNKVNYWLQGLGASSDQDKRGNVEGYESSTFGFAAGMDTKDYNSDLAVGAAIGYGATEVDSDNSNNTDTNIDSYQIVLYGQVKTGEITSLSAQLGYVWGNVETERHDIGAIQGLNAKGDYNTHQFQAKAKLSREYLVGLFTILSPYIASNYTYFNAGDYTETGAGGANLDVDQESLNIWELGAGIDAAWLLRFHNGSYIQPTLSFSIFHDLIDDKVEATNRFLGGGSSFQVKGFDSPQTSLLLGAGIEYVYSDKWKMSADYNYEARSDYDSHSGYVRASHRF